MFLTTTPTKSNHEQAALPMDLRLVFLLRRFRISNTSRCSTSDTTFVELSGGNRHQSLSSCIIQGSLRGVSLFTQTASLLLQILVCRQYRTGLLEDVGYVRNSFQKHRRPLRCMRCCCHLVRTEPPRFRHFCKKAFEGAAVANWRR